MIRLNSRISRVEESGTFKMKRLAAERRAAGKDVFDLSVGETGYQTPAHITDAIKTALDEGKTTYTAVPGLPELRKVASQYLKATYDLEYGPSEILISNGGKQSIYSCLDVVLEPDEKVVFFAPYWVSYPSMVTLSGGQSVVVNTSIDSGYKITTRNIEEALKHGPRFIIINNPNNPTGVVMSPQDLKPLAEYLESSDCLIIADEVYDRLVHSGCGYRPIVSVLPRLRDRIVTVHTLSKNYSMAGLRIGYAFGPEHVIAAMSKHQGQITSNVCSVVQYGAIAALNGPKDFIRPMVDSYERRISKITEMLDGSKNLRVCYRPDASFYLFIRMDALVDRTGKSGEDICMDLVNEVGVVTVPGSAFGEDKAFRIGVGMDEELLYEGIRRLIEYTDKM